MYYIIPFFLSIGICLGIYLRQRKEDSLLEESRKESLRSGKYYNSNSSMPGEIYVFLILLGLLASIIFSYNTNLLEPTREFLAPRYVIIN